MKTAQFSNEKKNIISDQEFVQLEYFYEVLNLYMNKNAICRHDLECIHSLSLCLEFTYYMKNIKLLPQETTIFSRY